jgi:Hsp70 protein
MDGATLYIDHGTATTTAVLRWSPRRIEHVAFDNHAVRQPGLAATEGLVGPPESTGVGAGTATEQRLAVSTGALKDVLDAATVQAQGPVDRVVMVVGAHRGPQWRAELRRSAQRAGITSPEIIDGAAAIARQLDTTANAPPIGARVVICDLGASGMEAAVFVRDVDGYDMRSLADNDTGGDAIDEAIAAHFQSAGLTAPQATSAKHALTHSNRVRVETEGADSMVEITQTVLAETTADVWAEYAATITSAVAGADEAIADISAVYLAGGTSNLPLAAQSLRELLDVPVVICGDPDRAALLAAASGDLIADVSPDAVEPTSPSRIRLHEVLGIALPGAAALLLLIQYVTSATPYPYTGNVVAPWGDLGLAALLTLITAIMAASALTVPGAGREGRLAYARAPVMTAAAVVGVIIAVIYGLIAQAYIELDASYLKVVLFSTLPLAIATVAFAHLPQVASRPVLPESAAVSWQRTISIVLAGAGVYGAQSGLFGTVHIVGHDQLAWTLLEHVGGGLLGAAFAVLLSRRVITLLYAAPAMALAGTAIAGLHTVDTLAYLYVAALTLWTIVHAVTTLQLRNLTRAGRSSTNRHEPM